MRDSAPTAAVNGITDSVAEKENPTCTPAQAGLDHADDRKQTDER
jgi:hypothetical protein